VALQDRPRRRRLGGGPAGVRRGAGHACCREDPRRIDLASLRGGGRRQAKTAERSV